MIRPKANKDTPEVVPPRNIGEPINAISGNEEANAVWQLWLTLGISFGDELMGYNRCGVSF